MALILFCGALLYLQFSNVLSLSICDETDNLFMVNSALMSDSDYNRFIVDLLNQLVFDALSERSAIGVSVYGDIPSDSHSEIIPLNSTKSQSTANKIDVIIQYLKPWDKVKLDVANTKHVALNETINVSAGTNIFILNNEPDELSTICNDQISEYFNNDHVYFIKVDITSYVFDIEYIYHCKTEMKLDLADLHEVTCPSYVDFGEPGTARLHKHMQYIEPNSILHCNFLVNKHDDKLLPGSYVMIDNNLDNEMSYQVGYIYIAKPYIFDSLPVECTHFAAAFKISHLEIIDNINDDFDKDGSNDTLLMANITSVGFWEYLDQYDISTQSKPYKKQQNNHYINDLYLNRRKLAVCCCSWGCEAHRRYFNADHYYEQANKVLDDHYSSHDGVQTVSYTVEQGTQRELPAGASIDGTGSISLSLSYSLVWHFSVIFHAKNQDLDPFIEKLQFGFEAFFGLYITNGELSFDGTITLSHPNLIDIEKAFLFYIDVIPVYVRAYITAELVTEIEASLHFAYNFNWHWDRTYKAYVNYSDGQWVHWEERVDINPDPFSLHNHAHDHTQNAVSCSSSITDRTTMTLNMGASLYEALNAHIAIVPSFTANVLTPLDCSKDRCGVSEFQIDGTMAFSVDLHFEPDQAFSHLFGNAWDGITIHLWCSPEFRTDPQCLPIPTAIFGDTFRPIIVGNTCPCPGLLEICLGPHQHAQSAAEIRAKIWTQDDTWHSFHDVLEDDGKFDSGNHECHISNKFVSLKDRSWKWLTLINCEHDGLQVSSVTAWYNGAYVTTNTFRNAQTSIDECVVDGHVWVEGDRADCDQLSFYLGYDTTSVYEDPSWEPDYCPTGSDAVAIDSKPQFRNIVGIAIGSIILCIINIGCIVTFCWKNCRAHKYVKEINEQ